MSIRTEYAVCNIQETSFLTEPVNTGRAKGVWGPVERAHLFHTPRAAYRVAHNVNTRNDHGPFAKVVKFRVQSHPRADGTLTQDCCARRSSCSCS